MLTLPCWVMSSETRGERYFVVYSELTAAHFSGHVYQAKAEEPICYSKPIFRVTHANSAVPAGLTWKVGARRRRRGKDGEFSVTWQGVDFNADRLRSSPWLLPLALGNRFWVPYGSADLHTHTVQRTERLKVDLDVGDRKARASPAVLPLLGDDLCEWLHT